MNNIITIKELCEQEIEFLNSYIEFSCNRSKFFTSNDYANKLILEFTEHRVNALTVLNKKKEFLEKINKYITDNCDHEWVNDYIDIDVEKSQNITYCNKCEKNKEY
mgnify:CR=1 FL=1